MSALLTLPSYLYHPKANMNSSSMYLKISNVPSGIDEKDLALTLVAHMDNSLTDHFVSCEVLRKEGAAMLEFDKKTLLTQASVALENILINGKPLTVLNKDDYMAPVDSNVGHSHDAPKALEEMDVDEGVGSDESSPMPDGSENIPPLSMAIPMSGITSDISVNGKLAESEVKKTNVAPVANPMSRITPDILGNGNLAEPEVNKANVDPVANPMPRITPDISVNSKLAEPEVNKAYVAPVINPMSRITPNISVNAKPAKPVGKVAPVAIPMSGIKSDILGKRKLAEPAVKKAKVGPVSHKVVYFDLETTGLDKTCCEIVQIAATCGSNNFNVFIMPERGIPYEASQINGLKVVGNNLLKNGKVVKVTDAVIAWTEFINFLISLGSVILVAHNGDWFDFQLLARDMKEHGLVQNLKSVVTACVDSLSLFKAKLPKRSKKQGMFRQVTLAKDFGISTEGAHDALDDVKVLAQLFIKVGVNPSDIKKHRKPFSHYL